MSKALPVHYGRVGARLGSELLDWTRALRWFRYWPNDTGDPNMTDGLRMGIRGVRDDAHLRELNRRIGEVARPLGFNWVATTSKIEVGNGASDDLKREHFERAAGLEREIARICSELGAEPDLPQGLDRWGFRPERDGALSR